MSASADCPDWTGKKILMWRLVSHDGKRSEWRDGPVPYTHADEVPTGSRIQYVIDRTHSESHWPEGGRVGMEFPMEFVEFPKLARFSREIIITEKIDGTNAQVGVTEDGRVLAGSRTRWVTTQEDNHGFAAWVAERAGELRQLGPGRHFGEFWGAGIQRRYGQAGKRFSLFNVSRWGESRPACCDVVPVLYQGDFDTGAIHEALERLRMQGSVAAPGFMQPEGIVIFHTAGNVGFKKTLLKDDVPKSLTELKAA